MTGRWVERNESGSVVRRVRGGSQPRTLLHSRIVEARGGSYEEFASTYDRSDLPLLRELYCPWIYVPRYVVTSKIDVSERVEIVDLLAALEVLFGPDLAPPGWIGGPLLRYYR